MKFSKRLSILLSAAVLTAGLQSVAKADKWTVQTSMPAGSFIFKHLDSWTPKLKTPVSYTHLTLPTICSV